MNVIGAPPTSPKLNAIKNWFETKVMKQRKETPEMTTTFLFEFRLAGGNSTCVWNASRTAEELFDLYTQVSRHSSRHTWIITCIIINMYVHFFTVHYFICLNSYYRYAHHVSFFHSFIPSFTHSYLCRIFFVSGSVAV